MHAMHELAVVMLKTNLTSAPCIGIERGRNADIRGRLFKVYDMAKAHSQLL